MAEPKSRYVMPMPHRDDRGIETGRQCYPTFMARVSAACAALNALSDPDPRGVESPYFAAIGERAIGLFNEEGENEDKPNENLEGWLVVDGDLGWTFIARKPEWAHGTPDDAGQSTDYPPDQP